MSEIKVGDRVEYTDVMKMQLGSERTNQQGLVVDVVRGEAGTVLQVFSLPDDPHAVLEADQKLRLDFVINGYPTPLRRLDSTGSSS